LLAIVDPARVGNEIARGLRWSEVVFRQLDDVVSSAQTLVGKEWATMGCEHAVFLFDGDVVDGLLALTWPQYLRKYGFEPGEWETPEEFLTDFALDPMPVDGTLASRIVRSWTLRRTLRRCSPQIFFIETVLNNVPKFGRTISVWQHRSAFDFFADLTMLRNTVIPAFLEGRINTSCFRAVMKIIDRATGHGDFEMTRGDRGKVSRALRENGPKSAFCGLPPVEDQYTTLSTTETQRFLRVIEEGWRGNWPVAEASLTTRCKTGAGSSRAAGLTLHDCRLVAELRSAGRKLRDDRPILAYYFSC
jgi:hypothetical protein